MKIHCKAILFDMDGTLVDSTPVVERAWGWWAERHKIPLDEILEYSHGRPTVATFEHFRPGADHTLESIEMADFEESEVNGIGPVPGADVAVKEATKGLWAVVTSAPRSLAMKRIAVAGLPLPDVLVPVDEIQNGKPHPEGFLIAAEKLGVDPADCLVFEDTSPGIRAGLNAGMQVVGLATTLSAAGLNHDPVVRDFRDVEVSFSSDGFEVVLRA